MTPETTSELARLHRYARLLDSCIRIPFTERRIGIDGLIGLIPGVGDAGGLILSAGVILAGARMGVPASVLLQMLLNVGVEAVVGLVPIAGDVFDFVWKANKRNVALIERYVTSPVETRQGSRLTLAGVAAGCVGLIVGVGWGAVALVQALLGG